MMTSPEIPMLGEHRLDLLDTGGERLRLVEAGEHHTQRERALSGRGVGAGDGRRRSEIGHVDRREGQSLDDCHAET